MADREPGKAGDQNLAPEGPVYQIRVEGHLGARWAGRFEGLALCQEQDGTTLLTGPLVDQAALHGLLIRIRNLCLPLISVNQIAGSPWRPERTAPDEQECGANDYP